MQQLPFDKFRLVFFVLGSCLVIATFSFALQLLFYFSFADYLDLTPAEVVEALWGAGLRFSVALAGMTSLIALFFAYPLQRWLGWRWAMPTCFALGLGLILLSWVGDTLYFSYSKRHIGYEVVFFAEEFVHLIGVALSTYAWQVALAIFFVLVGFGLGLRLFEKFSPPLKAAGRVRWRGLQWFVAFFLSAMMVRNGVQPVPLRITDAYMFKNPAQGELALNGAYSVIRGFISFGAKRRPPKILELPTAVRQRALRELYPVLTERRPPLRRYNLVLVFIESWAARRMKAFGNPRDVTPNFEAIAERGLMGAAIAGSGRTIESVFMVLCSSQSAVGAGVIGTNMETRRYHCLPNVLRDHGWSSLFFSSNPSRLSGKAAQRVGFELSYGQIDMDMKKFTYPLNEWGAHDFDFYRFALEKTRDLPEPFVIGLNTSTNHGVTLPPGVEPRWSFDNSELVELSVMSFADDALGAFIRDYEAAGFGPTIFALFGDHTARYSSIQAHEVQMVPLAIFATDPDLITPRRLDYFVSQRDIAPTLLNLLGGSEPNFTGVSLLSNDRIHAADFIRGNTLYWIEGRRQVTTSLQGKNLQCRFLDIWTRGMRNTPCTPLDQARQERGLAFSHFNQRVLFAGRQYELGTELNKLLGDVAPGSVTLPMAPTKARSGIQPQ